MTSMALSPEPGTLVALFITVMFYLMKAKGMGSILGHLSHWNTQKLILHINKMSIKMLCLFTSLL